VHIQVDANIYKTHTKNRNEKVSSS